MNHSKQVADALKELAKRPMQHFHPRDNREDGAVWPTHNSQDLPSTDWYVKDPE
jgi:hypothetical protein